MDNCNSVIFRVRAPIRRSVERVYVVGSLQILGSWDEEQAVAMATDELLYPVWTTVIDNLSPPAPHLNASWLTKILRPNHDSSFEYKYYTRKNIDASSSSDDSGRGLCRWEPMTTRTMRIPTDSSLIVEDVFGVAALCKVSVPSESDLQYARTLRDTVPIEEQCVKDSELFGSHKFPTLPNTIHLNEEVYIHPRSSSLDDSVLRSSIDKSPISQQSQEHSHALGSVFNSFLSILGVGGDSFSQNDICMSENNPTEEAKYDPVSPISDTYLADYELSQHASSRIPINRSDSKPLSPHFRPLEKEPYEEGDSSGGKYEILKDGCADIGAKMEMTCHKSPGGSRSFSESPCPRGH